MSLKHVPSQAELDSVLRRESLLSVSALDFLVSRGSQHDFRVLAAHARSTLEGLVEAQQVEEEDVDTLVDEGDTGDTGDTPVDDEDGRDV